MKGTLVTKLLGRVCDMLYYDETLIGFFSTEQNAWLYTMRDNDKTANLIHIVSILVAPTGELVEIGSTHSIEKDLHEYRIIGSQLAGDALKEFEALVEKDLAEHVEKAVIE